MGSHQTPLENRHAQAPRLGEVGGCTRPDHQGSVSSVAATLQRFTGKPSPLASGLHGGILQAPWPYKALQPTPWIAIAFPARWAGAADLVSFGGAIDKLKGNRRSRGDQFVALSERFNTGFLVLEDRAEEIFLSVTPGFERGPGIQRDGITPPRMSDPHAVARIRNTFRIPLGSSLPPTSDAYVQRAGTWTLYHHVKRFIKERGNDWLIVGIQSNGDLTMNHWHIAYLGESDPNQAGQVCGLLTDGDPQEPVASRVYRSIVKWKDEAAQVRGRRYECLSLRVERSARWRALKIEDSDGAHQHDDWLGRVPNYDLTTKDIAPLVEFALSGKPVVEGGVELALNNTIDRFEDVRHIFNLPSVPAKGYFRDQEVSKVNLGEYQLFQNLNERRAALLSPVIVRSCPGRFLTPRTPSFGNYLSSSRR